MSHQVLARKWRPRDFASLVGQEHVVRALSHALSTRRLHQAYLLTGTRGVGKTTIARILAKSLNCEVGLSATPCGQCAACTGIDGGRYVDYVEMDAASNRGVDEMAQVLENAVYAPQSGRYKVYVIDEVHMLSNHAFNAMLKTLEEPPPHVMFVLATTDPQKVPVTVLSRCLQFNLKNMAPGAIAEHLAHVLQAETIEHERAALSLIGRSAAGSMRDALSLLDQAIAFGGGRVTEVSVREMLGTVDHDWLYDILRCLAAGDAPGLLAQADRMQQANAPFDRALADLALLLQRIALAQVGVVTDDHPHEAALQSLAQALSPETVQVYYQIVIHGGRELALAPDALTGFSMTLLRLFAFRPVADASDRAQVAVPRASVATPQAPVAAPRTSTGIQQAPVAAPRASVAASRAWAATTHETAGGAAAAAFDGNWAALASRVQLGGFAQQFLEQSELLSSDDWHFRVRVPIRPLADAATVSKVRDALSGFFGRPVRVSAEVGSVGRDTAAAAAEQKRSDQLAQARQAIESDPFVQSLLKDFDGRIVPGSISPSGSSS
ncbi:MAG: polymerase subunit gamma/tau [Pseudomonadota bacterium]|jgi:DNA polymerase-3 subunit gamma/tau